MLIVGTPPGYSEFVEAVTPSEKCLPDGLRFAAWAVPVS